MKNLDFKHMKLIEGGVGTSTCLGAAVGMAAAFTFATIATGGAFAVLAMAAIGSMGSGAFCLR